MHNVSSKSGNSRLKETLNELSNPPLHPRYLTLIGLYPHWGMFTNDLAQSYPTRPGCGVSGLDARCCSGNPWLCRVALEMVILELVGKAMCVSGTSRRHEPYLVVWAVDVYLRGVRWCGKSLESWLDYDPDYHNVLRVSSCGIMTSPLPACLYTSA